ncbi:hypothetical protein [Mesorhizobium sp. WSM2239]|uniref:2TM domain-containing protein n=2 Tax=unclassified Mesorhizobium TaxID=325217 RepID=A0AAU8D265_9HYPH
MWKRIKKFFKDSETIFFARLQVFIGVVAVIITYVQPEVLAPILPGGWAPYAVVAHGFALEYLRRRRAEDL